MFLSTAYAETTSRAAANATAWSNQPLFWCELTLLLVVLVGFPLFSRYFRPKDSHSVPLRGLNLPNGSVRAMLAFLIVGSFINVLVFGAAVLGDHFEQVVTAFGTLAGSVTGFYFAARNASPPPASERPDSGAGTSLGSN